MPLDPQVQAFLKLVEDEGFRGFWPMTPEEARAVSALAAWRLPPPKPVAKTEDVTAPGPGGEIPLRIYTPEGGGPFPVFVYYHGGGWTIGDIPSHNGISAEIAHAANCQVVSVGYRLAPEHKFPAAPEDCFAATAWVFEHAKAFGGDPRRIAVGGDSAGGNLAAVVCLMARDRRAFRPVLQVLVYPATDHGFNWPSLRENAEGFLLSRNDMTWFWDHYLAQPEDALKPYAVPMRAADLRGLPPARILTAQYDPLRDEGEAYARRLRDAGVPVILTRYDGMIHAFLAQTAIFDKARDAIAEIGSALRTAFHA
jgi:acetyl esterase